jgi:hypothetical protein
VTFESVSFSTATPVYNNNQSPKLTDSDPVAAFRGNNGLLTPAEGHDCRHHFTYLPLSYGWYPRPVQTLQAMRVFMKCVPIAVLLLVPFATTAPAVSSPLSADQASVLESARVYSIDYIRKLPNFICTQITNRESIGFAFRSVMTSDVIEEQLTFANQKESYEVVRINLKKVSGVQHMAIPGAISAGEFGSSLHALFDQQSHAAFSWDRMARLRGHSVYVFAFQVPQEAGIRMFHEESGQNIVAPYTGMIFVDADTKEVIRITIYVELPPTFPVKAAEAMVDYKPVTIDGKDFTLPFHSEVRMTYDSHKFVNRIDYQAYHKFVAHATLRLDDDANVSTPATNEAPTHRGCR